MPTAASAQSDSRGRIFMFVRRVFSLVYVSTASILFGLAPIGQSAAQEHECSGKYQDAKAAGTLSGVTWPEFYSKCAAEAKANPAAAAPAAAAHLNVDHICSGKYQDAKAAGTLNGDTWPQFYSKCAADAKANPPASAAAAAAAPLDVHHICSGKYQDAKAAGTLKGETWPQFYSRCVAETTASPPAAEATVAPAAAPSAPAAVAAPAPAPAVVAAAPAPAPAVVAAAPAAPPAVVAAAPAAPPAVVAAAPAPAPAVVAAAPAAPPAVVAAAPAPAPAVVAAAPAPAPAVVAAAPAAPPAVVGTPGTAVFPTAIAPAHAGEKPDIARRKTCLDQFKANKATNANGGLKWIQKVGGYWKECDKHLKG
jgi:hypothetical protein